MVSNWIKGGAGAGAGAACETAGVTGSGGGGSGTGGSGGTGGNGAGAGSGGGDPASAAAGMETLAMSERRTILSTMCGVVSEHTGRMCTRSLRCPQHSDVQRKGKTLSNSTFLLQLESQFIFTTDSYSNLFRMPPIRFLTTSFYRLQSRSFRKKN